MKTSIARELSHSGLYLVASQVVEDCHPQLTMGEDLDAHVEAFEEDSLLCRCCCCEGTCSDWEDKPLGPGMIVEDFLHLGFVEGDCYAEVF